MGQFEGKTVLITGASRGIGAAAALHFAGEGANVVMLARSGGAIGELAEQIRLDGGNALACEADIGNHEQVRKCVDRAVSEFGTIDILVNNAGTIEPIARIADSRPDAWAGAITTNLTGAYNALRACLPAMRLQSSGIVVNISSGAATSALEGWSHYCASKAGLLSLTRCAHKELLQDGIHVVGLSPGTVATDMQTRIRASGVNPVSQLSPDTHIPPEWVARAIAFLCTDEARQFDGNDFSLKTEEGRKLVGLP